MRECTGWRSTKRRKKNSSVSTTITKQQMLNDIDHHLNNQRTIGGGSGNCNILLCDSVPYLRKLYNAIGCEWVCIISNTALLLCQCQFLFYLNRHQGIQTAAVEKFVANVRYPDYQISWKGKQVGKCAIFPSKEIFDDYWDATELMAQLEECLHAYHQQSVVGDGDGGVEDVDADILSITERARNEMRVRMGRSLSLPSFVSRYRALHVYSRICQSACAYAEQRHRWRLCADIYQDLLACERWSYSRGEWFVRLSLILDFHLKQSERALRVCESALADECIDVGVRNEIIKRYVRLARKMKKGINIPSDADFDADCQQSIHKYLKSDGTMVIDVQKLPRIVIRNYAGPPIHSITGQKSRFFGDDNQIYGVEQLVIQYFAEQENGGWPNAIHCESTIYRLIFTVFMCEELFASQSVVDGVFHHRYQSAPLDLNTPFFYLARKEGIERRVQWIAEGGGDRDGDTSTFIRDAVERFFADHAEGERIVGVNWKWMAQNGIACDELVGICECIGCHAIAMICKRLARNYRYFSTGLPDLLLWSESPRRCKVVEVKSARDRLTSKQMSWIVYIKEVARVEETVVAVVEDPSK